MFGKFVTTSGQVTSCLFFFFNDTATTEIYTLSLHDALPIYAAARARPPMSSRTATSPSTRPRARQRSKADPLRSARASGPCWSRWCCARGWSSRRSEEHTSELQSQFHLVCRLLLEKKKKKKT